jgi:integrase
MKAPKLLVRIPWSNRNFYLFQPVPGADWHVKFAPPERLRGKHGIGNRVQFTTGHRGLECLAAAKMSAALKLERYFKIDRESGLAPIEAERHAAESARKLATVGELLARYESKAVERRPTVKHNVQAMARMVTVVHGKHSLGLPCSVLNRQLVRDFERIRMEQRLKVERLIGEVARESQRELETRLARAKQKTLQATSAYLRQARSIVALAKMKFYEDMRLPDFCEFRTEQVEKPRKSRPKPLDISAITAMEAARRELRATDPGVYVANLMFSCWGMRDIEILHARRRWISGGLMHIIDRPEENYFPKGTERSFNVDPEVVSEILRCSELCEEDYLVPGHCETERFNAIYRRHSKWVSTWIKDHTRTSYELRRYAGSLLLDRGATIFQVRDFLGHKDSKTTEEWYLYRLQNRSLPTIGLTNLAPAAAA